MDLYRSDEATILVTPRGYTRRPVGTSSVEPWVTLYGSVSVTAGGLSASDGVNEKGLVANQLYLSGTKYENPDDRPTLSNISMVPYLLDNFATVQEALVGLDKLRIVSTPLLGRDWPVHIAIADASGDSAIIEFIDHKRIIHHDPSFRVMTNEPRVEDQLANLRKYNSFGGTQPIPGGIDPASRFVHASFYLASLTSAPTDREAIAKIFSVIGNVAVPFDAQVEGSPALVEDQWPTLWTTVADATSKVYYFRSTRSPFLYWVDLAALNLAPGQQPRQIDAYLPDLAGDISARFLAEPISRPVPTPP